MMLMRRFENLEEVWRAVESGQEVFCENLAYHITVESDFPQANKWTLRDGKLLRVTCKSNYFGALLTQEQIRDLFTLS